MNGCRGKRLPVAVVNDGLQPWTVYLLRLRDGSLYCGVTRDVLQRLAVHRAGRGSKLVRSRLPAVLAWTERADSRSAAQRREAEVKRMSKAEKEALAANWQASEEARNS